MVISVSRRCDIPRFRFDWFMERLNAGFVDVANPFNAAQIRRVSLRPVPDSGGADTLVFWTRDPRAILANVEVLEHLRLPFYVMVTVTGYPAVLEPDVPPAEIICDAMGKLAQKIGPQRVIWRYDPVFLSSITGGEFHRRNFSELARNLAGAVRRVIVSLYDEYGGAKRRIEVLEKAGVLQMGRSALPGPDAGLPFSADSNTDRLLADLAQTAGGAGMEIQSCAEAKNFEAFGIKAGACIDGELIRELWGIESGGRDKHQRPHCLCAQSADIGRYGDCPAGCVYCYAQR
jgi:hypothetical protein